MKYLSNKKGSSSILVILTFMMLGIFSLLGMLSSYSDYKLSQKNAAFTKNHYTLEGEAYSFLSQADKLVENHEDSSLKAVEEFLIDSDKKIFTELTEDGLIVSKTISNDLEKELLFEIILNENSSGFKIITLKEIPKTFEYEDEIKFEDVEVITP